MKKTMIGLVMFALAFTAIPVGASTTQAPYRPKTSWQVYYGQTQRLVVYNGQSTLTEVCYDGLAEDYNGFCVSPKAPTPHYQKKQRLIQMGYWGK